MARLDLEAAALTLLSDGEYMMAIYGGNYCGGWRRLAAQLRPFTISVSANQFKSLTAFFPDDVEVAITRTDVNLVLKSAAGNVQLRQWGEESEPEVLDKSNIELATRLPVSALLAESEIASDFVAPSMLRPIITGLRLMFGKDSFRIMAFDGSAALFHSTIEAKTHGEGAMVVPNLDFLAGVRLIDSGQVVVAKPKDRDTLIVYGANAMFRSVTIRGEWPNTERIVDDDSKKVKVLVSAAQIKGLVNSSKVLSAGPDIEVQSRKGNVFFGVNSEAGAFNTSVKGRLPADLRYDAGILGLTARLGEQLIFNMPDRASAPTVVDCLHRRCWIVTRI